MKNFILSVLILIPFLIILDKLIYFIKKGEKSIMAFDLNNEELDATKLLHGIEDVQTLVNEETFENMFENVIIENEE